MIETETKATAVVITTSRNTGRMVLKPIHETMQAMGQATKEWRAFYYNFIDGTIQHYTSDALSVEVKGDTVTITLSPAFVEAYSQITDDLGKIAASAAPMLMGMFNMFKMSGLKDSVKRLEKLFKKKDDNDSNN